MDLDGKIALITGSTRGIGKAIAFRLAKEGASVIINSSKSQEEPKRVLAQLPKVKNQNHCFIQADIRRPCDISRMIKEIRGRYDRLDILVNNAGTTRFVKHSDLEGLTLDIFDDIYELHLRGSFLCVQKSYNLLKKSQDALIVNIASIAATTAIGSNIAYCAMKAAVVNMTKSLARALAPDIRVNSISPGLTQTDLIKDWEPYKSEQLRKTPLGRLGCPEDIANAVYGLATSLTYVTGQDIVVDGGRNLE